MKTCLTIIMLLVASLSCAAGRIDELDAALRNDYSGARRLRIDSLARADGSGTFDRHMHLSRLYSDFYIDSAVTYAERALEAATCRRDSIAAILRRAEVYNSSLMMYKEASDIFDSVRPDSADTTLALARYTLGVQLFRNLEAMCPDSAMTAHYAAIKRAYRDSVLRITPDAPLIRANALLDSGNPGGALDILLPMAGNESFSPDNGAVYHVIAGAYAAQGDTVRQIEYLAMAAQADIANGVREYLALPELALLLYRRGDIGRAYRYMQRATSDATACGARVRLLGMSSTMSVISAAYADLQQRNRINLIACISALALLLVMLIVSLAYAGRRNKLLAAARLRQEEANSALRNASRVKEKYVSRFMTLSLDYLDKMEHYRAELFKTAARRNFDALYKAISSTSYIDRETESFYANFDEAFLELYPGFVDSFNSLLRPEERITLPKEQRLNTELRIFALMELGITESADIARFLHCSQSTVYNYRTRYRNKAIDREHFVRTIFTR